MDISTLKIDKKEVLRYAGHRGDYVPENVDAAAEKMCGLILHSISPKSRVIQCALQPTENGVVLTGSGLVLQGRDIKKHLEGCGYCYVLCATIGYQADMFIRSMQVQSALDGLMADAAATAAIEAYCDLLENIALNENIKVYFNIRGRKWEVDEFHGDNEGLVVAEIELGSEDEPFGRPSWLGEEVTGDRRYYNSMLSECPYKKWQDASLP